MANTTKLEAARGYILSQYNEGKDFRYDLLSRKIQIRCGLSDHISPLGEAHWRNLTDKDICTMACDCAATTGANVTDREIRIVLGSDVVENVHPLRDWLKRLPPYDSTRHYDWIDVLASQVNVVGDNETRRRWHVCFKKWFVAMVAGWMRDEVVNHQVLVLIGRQGIYKTTWLEHLLPPCLREYCTKMASVRELSKDDRIRIAEFGLINLDEIDAATPRELNMLKSVITSADVNERAAYGHTKERRIRCASFCASGNNREFLSDDTGNRRWLPFEVESIQNPWTTTVLYEYVYAQALWLLDYGFNYWFDLEDTAGLQTHLESFQCIRNEEELLSVYFEPVDPTEPKAVFMTASEIHAKLKLYGHIERPMPLNKFGTMLKRRGYQQRGLHNGKKGYIVKQIDNQNDMNKSEVAELLSAEGAEGTSL